MISKEIVIVFISALLLFAATVVIIACLKTGLEIKREIEAEKRKEQEKEERERETAEFLRITPEDDARGYQLPRIYGIKMKEAIDKVGFDQAWELDNMMRAIREARKRHEWRVPGYPEIIIREDNDD